MIEKIIRGIIGALIIAAATYILPTWFFGIMIGVPVFAIGVFTLSQAFTEV